MASNHSSNSVFKSVLVGGSMVALMILPPGCNSINNKTLSRGQAQEIVTDYINQHTDYISQHNGSTSDVQGVVQNEGASQAVATIAIRDFNYNASNGHTVKYTGKAVAEFSRYTDGRWSMTNMTINPDDVFSARRFTIAPESVIPLSSNLDANRGDVMLLMGLILAVVSPLVIVYFIIKKTIQKKSSLRKQS
jgi:hypothetical protein